MKIDRSTKLEDATGVTLEVDVTDEGVTLRTKNGRTFVLPTPEDVDTLGDLLFDVKHRLEDRRADQLPGAGETEPVPGAKVETPNPKKPAKATKPEPAEIFDPTRG